MATKSNSCFFFQRNIALKQRAKRITNASCRYFSNEDDNDNVNDDNDNFDACMTINVINDPSLMLGHVIIVIENDFLVIGDRNGRFVHDSMSQCLLVRVTSSSLNIFTEISFLVFVFRTFHRFRSQSSSFTSSVVCRRHY